MVRYRLLGPIALEGGRPIGSAQQRLLLALLALNANRLMPSDELVEELWGDDLPGDPLAALRTQIARLRSRLPPGVLVTEEGGYRLAAEPGEVDVRAFEHLFASGQIEDALSLWQGRAIAEFADRPALQSEAGRLEDLRLAALERRAENLLGRGCPDEAAAVARSVLVEHPEREAARATVMRALYAVGSHREALEVYQAWRHELSQHGLEPSPRLRELEARILQHRVGMSAMANLPTPVSSLIGREADISAALARLEGTRLLTLCGPGGVGKTRLALAVASAAAAEYSDGVVFCDLSKIKRAAQVPRAVAEVVGVADWAGRRLVDQIVDQLLRSRLLLVLDNCEHVIEGAASVSARLISSTAAVDVLATSRDRLAVAGERLLDVGPLSHEASAQLFIERAREADSSFDASRERIDEVCAALDGLPLALELAAARVRGLGIEGVARGLTDRLALLTGGPRDAPRHRSLAAVIEWSYAHLQDDEREAFDSLSVFAGRFGLEDAEAMGVTPGLLGRLVDRSLVQGHAPFRLLDTVRAYGISRLEAAGALPSVKDRHALWAVRLAERSAAGLAGPEERSSASVVAAHIDEMRIAHSWLVGRDEALARRLAEALHPWAFWRAHSEVFRWAEVTAATSSDAGVLASAAAGAWQRGDLAAAEAAARSALPHRRALEVLAEVHFLRGQLDEASSLYEQAAVAAEIDGDLLQVVWDRASVVLAASYGGRASGGADEILDLSERCGSLSAQAMAHFVIGETRGERRHLEQAVALAEDVGANLVSGIAGASLAALIARGEDPAAALEHYSRAITTWDHAGAWTPLWVTLRGLVISLTRLGAMHDAALLYGATMNPRTGPAPFGADLSLLHEARDRIRTELGEEFDIRVATGAALGDREVLGIALTAIERFTGTSGHPVVQT